MLILSRTIREAIMIGQNIELVVLGFRGKSVRLGIKAPREFSVMRKELAERIVDPESPCDMTDGSEADIPTTQIPTADRESDQLLHRFCSRRKLLRTPTTTVPVEHSLSSREF